VGVERPLTSRLTSSGTSSQPESLEGRTDHGWLDNWRRVVTRYGCYTESLYHFSHHRLFDGYPFKDSKVENFGTGS
jgi:hypothetical protein